MPFRLGKKILFSALIAVLGMAKVHAEDLKFVDEPENCFAKENYPCAVRAGDHAIQLQRGENVFQLAAETSVVWLSVDDIRVLEGRLWIEKSSKLSVRLLGSQKVSVNGEFFVIQENNQNLVLMNLNGGIQFPVQGFLKSETLPVGFQNWYGRRMTEGNVERGVVRPIDVPTFVAAWARTGAVTKAARREKVKEYKELWKSNIDQSSDLYKDIVDRRLASQENAAEALRRRQQKAAEERAKLRQMFREKNDLQ